jgi:hypothetical protein
MPRQKLSAFLRKAIKDSQSVYSVAAGAGLTYDGLMHFVSGARELTQREIDALVAYFNVRFSIPAKEKAGHAD